MEFLPLFQKKDDDKIAPAVTKLYINPSLIRISIFLSRKRNRIVGYRTNWSEMHHRNSS